MRAVQTDRSHLAEALRSARAWSAPAIAIDLVDFFSPLSAPGGEGGGGEVVRAIQAEGFEVIGFIQAARDRDAHGAHPEWMHSPQHGEWLRKFPAFSGQHPASVAPYIGLSGRKAFDHALDRVVKLALAAQVSRLIVADLQGPPMGCGCGNPSCRSWDNSPGEKVAESTYAHPEVLFPLRFFDALCERLPGIEIIPVLTAECERGIELDGVADPDGPTGTNLCQGVACQSPCARDYWPRLLAAFQEAAPTVGLNLMVDALERNHPVYGEPRAWAKRAHRHYGSDLWPVIEATDAARFDRGLIALGYDQSVWPVEPPEGYSPSEPPIACGCD